VRGIFLSKIAKGKRPTTGMNTLEERYSNRLDDLLRSGEILWWAFEPVRLKLAHLTSYCPDFLVLTKELELEVHEVKGFWRDDARVKIKVAASKFPFRFIAATPKRKKDGGGWKLELFEGWNNDYGSHRS